MDPLLAIFLNFDNLLIIFAPQGLQKLLHAAFPSWSTSKSAARLDPVIPLLLAPVIAFLPGIQPDLMWGSRIALGFALGGLSGQIRKAWRQSIRGMDPRLQTQWPQPLDRHAAVLRGPAENRPAARPDLAGAIYIGVDTGQAWRCDGHGWAEEPVELPPPGGPGQ